MYESNISHKYLLVDQFCRPLAGIAGVDTTIESVQDDSPFLFLAFLALRNFGNFNSDIRKLLNQFLYHVSIVEVLWDVLDHDTLFRHLVVDPIN